MLTEQCKQHNNNMDTVLYGVDQRQRYVLRG